MGVLAPQNGSHPVSVAVMANWFVWSKFLGVGESTMMLIVACQKEAELERTLLHYPYRGLGNTRQDSLSDGCMVYGPRYRR